MSLSGTNVTNATAEDITQIYVAGFLRPPELGGFNYWMAEAQAGKSADQIAAIIFSLSVVKAIYPDSMDNTAFVTAIYQNVFSRAPDNEGLNYWRAQLDAGLDRGMLTLKMIRAGLGTPDGTPGKSMIVNRMDFSRYALAYQQSTGIEITPDQLAQAFGTINENAASVEQAKNSLSGMMSISPQQAARFLQQASFASTPSEIASVQTQGYAAWLDAEFNKPVSPSNYDWLIEHGYATADFMPNFAGSSNTIWQRLISAPDALRQRATLALSEFFVVGQQGVNLLPFKQFVMAAWWDMLCAHAFGNFRDLLEAVTLSAAMGRYLNTSGNQKEDPATGRQPDENYAREVLQLFTIGLYALNPDGSAQTDANGKPLESYTQAEVSQLARVFTGWTIPVARNTTTPDFARLPMQLNASTHSTLEARFLGTTIPANTDETTALRLALDTLFMHPNVGPFFGKQLIQRLITSNPSPAYVSRVSAVFNDNGQGVRGDMQAVIRAVLLDDEARNERSLSEPNFGKLREPILRFLQWARSFRANSADGSWSIGDLSNTGTALGQQPLNSPSVFNFFRPGYIPPNTSMAEKSLVAPEFQLVHETSIAGYMNFMQTTIASGRGGVRADYSTELALAPDANALVEHCNLVLCAGQLSATTAATIRDAINTISTSTSAGRQNRVNAAILMSMSCANYLVQR